jgi:hypothetical protein
MMPSVRIQDLHIPLRSGLMVAIDKPVWERGEYDFEFMQVGGTHVVGIISHDSYGPTGRHTFTLRDSDGSKHFIKARHAYRNARVICRDWRVWFRGAWISYEMVRHAEASGSYTCDEAALRAIREATDIPHESEGCRGLVMLGAERRAT